MTTGTQDGDCAALWQMARPFLGHPAGRLRSLGGTPQIKTEGRALRAGPWAGLGEERRRLWGLGRASGVCKKRP